MFECLQLDWYISFFSLSCSERECLASSAEYAYLEEHAEEGVDLEDPEGDGDEVLVEEGRDEEDDDLRRVDRVAVAQHRLEHVTNAPCGKKQHKSFISEHFLQFFRK